MIHDPTTRFWFYKNHDTVHCSTDEPNIWDGDVPKEISQSVYDQFVERKNLESKADRDRFVAEMVEYVDAVKAQNNKVKSGLFAKMGLSEDEVELLVSLL
jgi:hypothetical protein